MRIVDHGGIEEGRPLNSGPTIKEEDFKDFEPIVSQKILMLISEKSLPVPTNMSTVAVIRSVLPQQAGRWHYGENLSADVDGTKLVLADNCLSIWLCDSERFVLKLSPVFHSHIIDVSGAQVDAEIKRRMLKKLKSEQEVATLKMSEVLRQYEDLQAREKLVASVLREMAGPR